MRRRIVIEMDNVDKQTTDELVDRIYDLLRGKSLGYSVWVESFKGRLVGKPTSSN